MNNGLPVAFGTLINIFLVRSKVYETNCKKKGILNYHLSINDKILLLGMSEWQVDYIREKGCNVTRNYK